MWQDVRDVFNTELDGGDWAEGWNYGPRAMRHLIGYPWALETGTDRPNHWNEIDITSELVRSHISMLHPSRELCSDDGRWSGDFKGDPRQTTCRMMSVLSDTDPTARGLAVWYANHLTGEVGPPDPWERMLFIDRSIAEIAPTTANIGGLTWKMWGHTVTRSADWNNLNATFVDVVAWKHAAEEANFGEVKIASRQEPLLVDGQTYQLEAEFANVPRITGAHTYAPYQEYWHEPAVMTVDSLDGVYAYHKIANFHYAYNGVNDDTPSASYFRRDIVFLAPDHVVVFDNITASSLSNNITEQWHLMGDPVLSGDTATLTRPTAKLFARTVTPATTLTKNNTNASREGTFRINAAVVTPAIANRIVTVFEAADTTQPAMTALQTLTPAGFTGIHVQDASGPGLVLFATGENAVHSSLSFSFVPVAASTRVVMIGMQASTGFNVAITPGSGGALNLTVGPGTTYTSMANGSLTFAATPSAGVGDWMMYQ